MSEKQVSPRGASPEAEAEAAAERPLRRLVSSGAGVAKVFRAADRPGPKSALHAVPGAEPGGDGPAKPGRGRGRAKRLPGPAGIAEPDAPVRPVAARARPKGRHRAMIWAFLGIVVLPLLVTAWYLYARAVDQYASIMSFSVRSEDSRSAMDLFGSLQAFGGGSVSTDADILYQFLQSQELVQRLDADLDLRGLYATHYARDPIFGLAPGASIEDLVDHWGRMTRIAYDPGTGLIELRVLAFDPETARRIAERVLSESTVMINRLSDAARADATRYAREDLDAAEARLRDAREAITAFRSRTQIVDPAADLQGQMGVLNSLQSDLAAALVELDLLRDITSRADDPRIVQTERRISAIRARIAEERQRFSEGGEALGGEDYASIVAEYERLSVDREFAEQAYRSALAAHDAAVAEANRNSRYLAAHVMPTLAETARFPQRAVILGVVAIFLVLIWATGVLIYYSVRDRL